MFAVLLAMWRSTVAVSALHLQKFILAARLDLFALLVHECISCLANTHLLAILFAIVASFVVIIVMVAVVAFHLDILMCSTLASGYTLVINSDEVSLADADLTANAILALDLCGFSV